jgi:hypothetical protein
MGSLGSGSANFFILVWYSDRWYKFDHYDSNLNVCVWNPITPCSTLCQDSFIDDFPPCPSQNGPNNYLEGYYFWWMPQNSSAVVCIIAVPVRRASSPGTCSG